MSGLVYVYAFAEPGLPSRFTAAGRTLRVIDFEGVVVLVGRGVSPEPTIEAVRRQHTIVGALGRRCAALLPARFGSLISEEDLRRLVRRRRQELRRALREVRDCEQMTVRVFGARHVELDSPRVSPSGTAFLERRREAARYAPPEVAVVRATLGKYVKSERVHQGTGSVRATIFHLVARPKLAKYTEAAATLPPQVAPAAVTVTGPWPPFAFAPELL